eukprot:544601_1
MMLGRPLQFRTYIDSLSDHEYYIFAQNLMRQRELITVAMSNLLLTEALNGNDKYGDDVIQLIEIILNDRLRETLPTNQQTPIPWPSNSRSANQPMTVSQLSHSFDKFDENPGNAIPKEIVSNHIFIYLRHSEIISCVTVCKAWYIAVAKFPDCITDIIHPKNDYPLSKLTTNYGNSYPLGARISAMRSFHAVNHLKISACDMIKYGINAWKFKNLTSLHIDSLTTTGPNTSILLQFDNLFQTKINYSKIKTLQIVGERSMITLPQLFYIIKKYQNVNKLVLHNTNAKGQPTTFLTPPYLILGTSFAGLCELILDTIDGRTAATLLNHVGPWIKTLRIASSVDLGLLVVGINGLFQKLQLFQYFIDPKYLISVHTLNNLIYILQKDNLRKFQLHAVDSSPLMQQLLYSAVSNKEEFMLHIDKLGQLECLKNAVNRIMNNNSVQLAENIDIFCSQWVQKTTAFDNIIDCLSVLYDSAEEDYSRFDLCLNVKNDAVDKFIEDVVDDEFDDYLTWQSGERRTESTQIRVSNKWQECMKGITKIFS